MRILGRGLILLLLLLLTWLAYCAWLNIFHTEHLNLATPYPNAIAARNDVYLLSLSQPSEKLLLANAQTKATTRADSSAVLSFQLDQRIERLQIASIPMFPIPEEDPDAFSQENIDLMRQKQKTPKYAIEYRLLDDKNKILSQESYWFNAIPSSWTTLEDNSLIPELYLSDSDYYAGKRQSIFLRMSNWPTAAKLELRMHNQPQEIVGSSIYVRQHFNRTKEEATVLWRKLSDEKRTSQTQNVHMYPHYIWENSEINSLLSNYWLQLGPVGIVGKDFITLGLYRIKNDKPDEIAADSSSIQPSSQLQVNKNKHLTFPIHIAGEVQFTFRPLHPSGAGKILTIILHPVDASAPIIMQKVIQQTTATWQGFVPQGLLELKAEPILDIEIETMPDELSENHKHHLTRNFIVDANTPLTYPIEHWRDQGTPIKIELRAILNQPGLITKKDTRVEASWRQLDEQVFNPSEQQVKAKHALPLDYQVSRYEHLASAKDAEPDAAAENNISESSASYFLAPKSINHLTITSTSPVIIKVSSRPLELPLLRKVPSHNRGWFDDESYLPAWYTLRPLQYNTLINQGNSIKLRTQHRPLVDRYADLIEELVGEKIVPNQAQANHNQILIPESQEEKIINSSPTRRYLGLSSSIINSSKLTNKGSNQGSSEAERLYFSNTRHSRSLSPSLVYKGDHLAPRKVEFILDNKPIHSQWINGHLGKITLPKITKGLRTLKINSNYTNNSKSEHWYVNQVDYVKGANYLLLKEGYSFNPKTPLTYNIEKTSSETLLNFTFYQERLNHSPVETLIEVKLLKTAKQQAVDTTRVSTSMTIPIRHWHLESKQDFDKQGFILNRGNRKTDGGSHFVYSLADDLPMGEYKIQVSLKEGSGGYLNVSRLVPKPGVDIDYFKESIHAY